MITMRGESERTFTPKGWATRQRIIEAASRLILENGLEAATLEEIQAAAGASASQLYHYFEDKSELLRAVIEHQTDSVLGTHRVILERLDSFEALEEWRDMVVSMLDAQNCVGGCPLGSLASGLAESDARARTALAESFERWQDLLREGLETMRQRGELRDDANVGDLSTSVLAAVQGGLLLSQTRRDSASVRVALDASIAYLRTLRPERALGHAGTATRVGG
ncbi:TetR/AcrR family transcriptional regulator [Leifsonia sp. 22587]|uniref:TetR/AcrR family transcriptional regulator n=1 Tax=Leifsonia sp. 22587 TaxID=3453946 RepID=UPI003F87C3C8